jgi:diaminopimelate decarboxylase
MSKDFRYPTPYYLFDRNKFESNIYEFVTAFKSRYGNFKLGYSFKTNNSLQICNVARISGCLAEVVSPTEYELAVTELEYKECDIIYNGVIDDFEGKLNAARKGSIVNIDCIDDLEKFASYCESNQEMISFGVRLNIDISNNQFSRFGIDVESDDFNKLIDISSSSKFFNIDTIHSHIYGGRELKYWITRTEKMIHFAKILKVKNIDFGSNLYGKMDERLKAQFGSSIPTFSDYAEVVCSRMKKEFPKEDVTIIFECGTPIVADTVSLVSSVVSTKTVKGRMIANMDSSIYNVGFIANTKNIPMDVLDSKHGDVPFALYGYTCTEGDILQENVFSDIKVGDRFEFKNIGAYGSVLESNFIQPPISMIQKYNDDITIIKMKCGFNYMIRNQLKID